MLAGCVDSFDFSIVSENDDGVMGQYLKENRITLIDHKKGGLQPGNTRIVGINHEKYYIAEVFDEAENPIGTLPKYLSSMIIEIMEGDEVIESREVGILVDDLEEIVRMGKSDKLLEVIDLDNKNTYEVWSSDPLKGKVTFYTAIPSPGDAGPLPIDIKNGEALYSPTTSVSHYYLGLGDIFKKDGSTFTIIRIAVIGGNTEVNDITASNFDETDKILTLQGEDTITEYLFIERDSDGKIIDFMSLVVEIEGLPPTGDLTITLTSFDSIEEIDVSAGTGIAATIYISELEFVSGPVTKTIIVNSVTGVTFEDFVWRYAGYTFPENSETLTIDFNSDEVDQIGLTDVGVHTITVYVRGNGKYWSGSVDIEVTDNPSP